MLILRIMLLYILSIDKNKFYKNDVNNPHEFYRTNYKTLFIY